MIALFAINVQLYSQNHKITLLSHLMVASGNNISALSESVDRKYLYSRECRFNS